MGDHIGSELRRAFALASMQKEAEVLRRPADWAEVKEVRERSQLEAEREKKLYREHYDTRVEAARRSIIDEAGGRTRTFAPGWAGTDRFDADDTLRQAQRQVRNAHEQQLGRIAAMELAALTAIVERARRDGAGPQTIGPVTPSGPEQPRQRTGPDQ